MLCLLATLHKSCENQLMADFVVVYYHYFRHHRDQRPAYEVTERELTEAQTIALKVQRELDLPVEYFVEHFDTLPEAGSRYLELIEARRPTVVVMNDMRIFAQTAGVKGLRLLRDSLDAGVIPVIKNELPLIRNRAHSDLLHQRLSVIGPLTSHIDNEKPHGNGRNRTMQITLLMRSAFSEIKRGNVVDRESLLSFMQSEVESRFHEFEGSLVVFSPDSWRTYKYKIRRRIEEMISKTYTLLGGPEKPISVDSVWSTVTTLPGCEISVPAFVADACIRQLDGE
jgi:hypothetical protein